MQAPSVCSACGSVENELRRRVVAGGAVQYRYQCLGCGRSLSNALPHAIFAERREPIPEWDDTLSAAWEQARAIQSARKFEQGRVELTAEYAEYLQSPVWQSVRRRVLNRSEWTCEGCLRNPAEHVHHLTYEHVKREFLFELVALCAECHARIHADAPR